MVISRSTAIGRVAAASAILSDVIASTAEILCRPLFPLCWWPGAKQVLGTNIFVNFYAAAFATLSSALA